MRLLICFDRGCRTMEEIPDFDGPPEHDVLLDLVVEKHQHTPETTGNLLHIEDKDWNDQQKREAILDEIRKNTTGFESEFYATKNTFVEDAGKCYNRHNRPKDFCIDWHDESKRLSNPMKQSQTKVYLCDFCVVSSRVNEKKFDKGLWTP